MQYLDQIDALVNRFAEYGMMTIVDNHQDMFSRRLCGEGVPVFYQPWDTIDHECPWSIIALGTWLNGKCKPFVDYDIGLDEHGLPLIKDCLKYSFMDLYTAPEVASSF